MLQRLFWLCAASVLFPTVVFANNACLAPAFTTAADVTTSDGDAYEVRTTYRNTKELAVEFIRDGNTTFAVEGGLVWARNGENENNAGDGELRFALGHQYHAIILRFDEIMRDVIDVDVIPFGDRKLPGRTGKYPTGGEVSLVDGDIIGRPAGLFMVLPGTTPITVRFNDWREIQGDTNLPHKILIEHEGVLYTYQYTRIDIEDLDAIDFHERYAAPNLDAVQIHRLHRALLTAHCRGDAAMMAHLTTPEATIANRGAIIETTREAMETQFEELFSNLNYLGYHDLKDPMIKVSTSGDLGWAIVNVRAEAQTIDTTDEFSQDWAWVMLAKKQDGIWLHTGNASNAAPQ